MKYKIVVLGANGLTGRLVVEHLLKVDALLRRDDGSRGWAVAGRNREKIEESLRAQFVTDVEILHADLNDEPSLKSLAERAEVILSLAGPYTPSAEKMIAACVEAGTSYADLSGEIPLLRRVIERFDASAKTKKVKIVQMCGWEAFPADVATLMASREVAGSGAASPIRDVTVTIAIENKFEGRLSLNQQVSAGTLASLVQVLEDPEAHLLGLEESLIPETKTKDKQIEIGSFEFAGKIYGPVVPVPYLNPPVIRRTAYLLAREKGVAYQPVPYREGMAMGSARSDAYLPPKAVATVSGYVQSVVGQVTQLPLVIRRPLAQGLKKILPPSGSGPSGVHLRDWTWTVTAHVTSSKGERTPAMIVEVGLQIVLDGSGARHFGCITPALALGAGFKKFYVDDLKVTAPTIQ